MLRLDSQVDRLGGLAYEWSTPSQVVNILLFRREFPRLECPATNILTIGKLTVINISCDCDSLPKNNAFYRIIRNMIIIVRRGKR